MLGLTSRETADLAKKSHDVSRDVLGKPGITKRFFVESHDVPTNVMGLSLGNGETVPRRPPRLGLWNYDADVMVL